MALGEGQIFASGFSILLKGSNDPLAIPDGKSPIKYLHLVDESGNTIIPTYEPDGLDAGQGTRIAGAKYTLVSSADLALLSASLMEQLAALTARVTALEALLVDGVINVDTIEVRRIIARGTGESPDPNVADLQIVTKTQLPGVYDEMVKVVGKNYSDMDPKEKLAFFGETAVAKQTVTTGFDVDDLQDTLENYGLVEEVSP